MTDFFFFKLSCYERTFIGTNVFESLLMLLWGLWTWLQHKMTRLHWGLFLKHACWHDALLYVQNAPSHTCFGCNSGAAAYYSAARLLFLVEKKQTDIFQLSIKKKVCLTNTTLCVFLLFLSMHNCFNREINNHETHVSIEIPNIKQ